MSKYLNSCAGCDMTFYALEQTDYCEYCEAKRAPLIWARVAAWAVLAVVIAMLLTACAPARQIVKPEPVYITKYIKTPIPPDLLQPCTVAEPDPACWREGKREFCNGQVAQLLLSYRIALAACEADKAALRSIK